MNKVETLVVLENFRHNIMAFMEQNSGLWETVEHMDELTDEQRRMFHDSMGLLAGWARKLHNEFSAAESAMAEPLPSRTNLYFEPSRDEVKAARAEAKAYLYESEPDFGYRQ